MQKHSCWCRKNLAASTGTSGNSSVESHESTPGKSHGQLPARTGESDAMSKDLKSRGFNFVGSTICYAFMQAVGMVNDHIVECFRYKPLAKSPRANRSTLAERARR